mmetsp:Transcript_90543/g.161281  ORF Transcript_90543/g.161281 Transcript_90543/m.161281 type:complete len:377 (-) Transcript_90543:95-1225(-)
MSGGSWPANGGNPWQAGGGGQPPNPFMFMQPGQGMPGGAQQGMNPLQMLFQGGLGNADPLLVEQLFAAAGMGGAGFFEGGHDPGADGQEDKKGAPPASASVVRSLPRVKVSAYDIAANESPECSVCLGDLVIGEKALRIPCGHLYHEECVKDWLKKSNECPVCRWELPTDDSEYERGRAMRMAGRKIRLRRTDLSVKTAAELRHFAHFIGVDVKDCLEKGELVEKISQSQQVQIIDPVMETSGGSSPSAPVAGRVALFTQDQLQSMCIADLKAILERMGLACPSKEKAELVAYYADAGLVRPDDEVDVRPPDVEMTSAPEVSQPTSSAAAPSGPPLEKRSVGQLKQLALDLGISLDGCLEKGDIVERISSSPSFRG